MASILYKWFMMIAGTFCISGAGLHPLYVSVTEITHNAKDKSLEVSCRIFTNDFETTLRKTAKIKVDLLNPSDKAAMDALVNNYIRQHLKIAVNGTNISLKYLGYEQVEDAIESYFQAENINAVRSVSVQDNILYEYKEEQMSLLHITVNGNRKSTRLNNPDDKVTVTF